MCDTAKIMILLRLVIGEIYAELAADLKKMYQGSRENPLL
jgi:hypothetical protein